MPEVTWRRILCPIDFSAESRAALRVAVDLARRFGAALTILHVRDRAAPRLAPQGQADGSLEEAAREARSGGAGAIATEEIEGDPRQDIAEHAERAGYDLVVMGTHGRTGRDRTLAGSVAESTVRRSRCPVLVVHPEWSGLPA
jgi:universal stress protein A